MKQLVLDEVKSYFRPELLNRFDEQIVFQKLGLKEVRVQAMPSCLLAWHWQRVLCLACPTLLMCMRVCFMLGRGHAA